MDTNDGKPSNVLTLFWKFVRNGHENGPALEKSKEMSNVERRRRRHIEVIPVCTTARLYPISKVVPALYRFLARAQRRIPVIIPYHSCFVHLKEEENEYMEVR
jgi:hypothetical protein